MLTNPAADSSLGPVACPFCDRANPPASRFCNACGAPLPLVPCARCGAVNDPAAKTCYQCAAPLPQSTVADGSTIPNAGLRAAEGRAEPVARPKPVADAPDGDADLLAKLQEMRRVLGAADPDEADRRPDAAGPAGGTETRLPVAAGRSTEPPPPRATASSTPDEERFDLGPPPDEQPMDEEPHIVRRWQPAAVAGALGLALAAGVWYVLQRAGPAPAVPASTGVVTERISTSPAARPVDPPVARTEPVPAPPVPAPAPAVAAIEKSAAPAAKTAAPASRPETPSAETPRLRLSAPPPDAAPAGPPRPTAAVRIPEQPTVPAPPPAAKAQKSGPPAPGVIERQPAYTGQCNDGAAALGLCAPAPSQRRE